MRESRATRRSPRVFLSAPPTSKSTADGAALSGLSSRATAERDSNSEESSLSSTSTLEWRMDSNLLSGTHHEQTQQSQVYA